MMDEPTTQLDRDNPWPGLESFEEAARDYFHGREAEAEDLLRRVADAPLTVLFGKSGLGKTSLLKAGLFPRLREKNFLPVHVRLDIRPEAPGLIEQLRDGLLAEVARERVDAPPFAEGETLWEYLHREDLELWSEQNYPLTPVLVLDQFEEVFTLGARLPERVERFKIDLGDLAENRIPVALATKFAVDPSTAQGLDLRRMGYKLVVTLREDFLPHLESWRAAVPSLGRVRVRLLPMRREQALSAVYDTAPHLMDEPLARRIVEFVAAAAQGERAAQESRGGEIEPALLSLFCRGLNERRKRQGADRFDEQLLEGAQQSIIADYYRSCVEGLPDRVSRFIETDLITEKGFRNSYAKDDAVPGFLTEEQLGRLINRRLLRVEERYGTARIELTHDLLTRAVRADRDRRRVDEEKAALARRAEEEREALAVQARTQRRRVLAMAFVALVCLAFAGMAAWKWREAVAAKEVVKRAETIAQKATADAKTAWHNSEARRLEAEARLVFDESGEALVKATLLSVASVRHTRTVDGQSSLTQFLGLLPRAPLWRRSVTGVTNPRRQSSLAVSHDGARIAVVGESGPVQLLDARTGQPLRSFNVPRNNARLTVLAFSPDGAFLVVGCAHQACVLDAANGQLRARLPGAEDRHGDMVWSPSFSPDGKRLAMSSYESGEVLLYDVASWHKTAIRSGGSSVLSVAFSQEGEWLATGVDKILQLWRTGRYRAPAAQDRTNGLVRSIAFQPDGSGLIAAGNRLQAWRIVRDGSSTRLDAGESKTIIARTVVPVSGRDQPCFAAAAPHGVHLLCDTKMQEVLRVPVSSVAAAVSPDGRLLFNVQDDGMLAAWPLKAGPDAFRIPLGAPIGSISGTDRWLAAGLDNGEVAIIGLDSWKERKSLRLPAAAVEKVTASSDGRWLAVSQGPSLHVFDTTTWREVASGTYGDDDVGRIAFAAGDSWLVAVTGATVVVWETGTWRPRRLEHDGTIESVRVSLDGRQLATATHWTAGHDAGVYVTRIFDLASGNENGWEYTSGNGNISRQFMRDEAARRQRVLAGGDTRSVREAASSWPALALTEPRERKSADGVWNARFSGSVATLRDAAANRAIADFDHGAEIASVRFVPTLAPRWLVTAGEDGTVAAWPIRTDDLAREACTRLRTIFGPQALGKLIADAHAEGSCEGN